MARPRIPDKCTLCRRKKKKCNGQIPGCKKATPLPSLKLKRAGPGRKKSIKHCPGCHRHPIKCTGKQAECVGLKQKLNRPTSQRKRHSSPPSSSSSASTVSCSSEGTIPCALTSTYVAITPPPTAAHTDEVCPDSAFTFDPPPVLSPPPSPQSPTLPPPKRETQPCEPTYPTFYIPQHEGASSRFTDPYVMSYSFQYAPLLVVSQPFQSLGPVLCPAQPPSGELYEYSTMGEYFLESPLADADMIAFGEALDDLDVSSYALYNTLPYIKGESQAV